MAIPLSHCLFRIGAPCWWDRRLVAIQWPQRPGQAQTRDHGETVTAAQTGNADAKACPRQDSQDQTGGSCSGGSRSGGSCSGASHAGGLDAG